MAGDADSMGESRSVPPFQGGVHWGRIPRALPWAIGFRPSGAPSVTVRRGDAVFLGTAYGVQSIGASLGLYRLFHAPFVTQRSFASKPADNSCLRPGPTCD
jgi:hypothetical protein